MIFETLSESAEKKELLLVDGGLLHYHLRRDGQITIREIIVLPEKRKCGIGRNLVSALIVLHPEAVQIVAVCPDDLPSNGFYARLGFRKVSTSRSGTDRLLNRWCLCPMVLSTPYSPSDLDNHWSHL